MLKQLTFAATEKNIMAQKITGQIVDILNKKIFDGEVEFDNGKIISINPLNSSTPQLLNLLLRHKQPVSAKTA